MLFPSGPRPGPPKNLTVTEINNGFLISWEQPNERANLVLHYTIKYRTDAQWKTLNKGTIRPEETQYLGNWETHTTHVCFYFSIYICISCIYVFIYS